MSSMLWNQREMIWLLALMLSLRVSWCSELHLDEEACGIGWKPFGKSCYKIYTEREQWEQSVAKCILVNAYLVRVNSKAELHFLYHSFVKPLRSGSAWIGLSRHNTSFRWSDGSAMQYKNWNYGEPNNSQGNEDCAEIFVDNGLWNDIPCHVKRPYVCEKDAFLTHPTNQMSTSLENKDHALTQHTFEVHDVAGISQCFEKCLANDNCFSFNFQYTGVAGATCELNNSTRAWAREAFLSRSGFIYFD